MCVHECVCMFTCMCMNVGVCVCLHVRVCAWNCVCVCTFVLICAVVINTLRLWGGVNTSAVPEGGTHPSRPAWGELGRQSVFNAECVSTSLLYSLFVSPMACMSSHRNASHREIYFLYVKWNINTWFWGSRKVVFFILYTTSIWSFWIKSPLLMKVLCIAYTCVIVQRTRYPPFPFLLLRYPCLCLHIINRMCWYWGSGLDLTGMLFEWQHLYWHRFVPVGLK